MEVARALAGLQESLSDCKKPQEGTVLSVLSYFNFIYTCTHVCVYMYIFRNRLVFALYLWQKHSYFYFFFQVVPFNRGSLNTGNFLFVFNCILHAGKLGLQNNSSYSVRGGGNSVRS